MAKPNGRGRNLAPFFLFLCLLDRGRRHKKAPERQDSLTLCYKETVIALGNEETLQNKYTMFSVGMQEELTAVSRKKFYSLLRLVIITVTFPTSTKYITDI